MAKSKKSAQIIDTVDVDGKSYKMVCIDIQQEGTVSEIPMRIKDFIEDMERGKISRDTLIQREINQWSGLLKSNFIYSIMINRPIGTILTATGRSDTQNYAVNSLIDGLQRSTTIYDFVNDKFRLSNKLKPIRCKFKDTESGDIISKEFAVAGKRFNQLPEILRDAVLDYRLIICSYKGFSDDELDNILYCVNSGKSPTSYQKMRFALGSNAMRTIQPMCDSDLWEDVAGCTAKNDSILCAVLRVIMMYSLYNCTNYGISEMNKFVDDFDENTDMQTLTSVNELIEQFADIKNQMTDDELTALNACSIPHFIIGLDRFNAICEKKSQDKTYLECYRAFIASDDYKKFLEFSQSGSGTAQYSADSVEDRQYIFDGFIEDFFDLPLPHNGIRVDVESDTSDADIVDEPHTNIIQIKNTADVIDAEFNENYTDDFVQAVLNSD